MTRQVLNRGTIANDGNGDTLRTAALKIEQNFIELYKFLGGDSDVLSTKMVFDSDGIIFEGTSIDDFEVKLKAANATADRVLTLPDANGEFVLTSSTQTLTNKTLTSPTVSGLTLTDGGSNHEYSLVASDIAANRNITLPVLLNNDEFTFNNHVSTLTNKTLTTPTILEPIIQIGINDSNGNEMIAFESTSGAINHVAIKNAALNGHPQIKAMGNGSNLDLELHSKDAGAVAIMSKLALSIQHATNSSVTVDLNEPVTFFNRATAVTATMPVGTRDGETKHLVNINSGTVTLTVTGNDVSRDNIELTSGASVTLIWSATASDWFVLNNQGATIS
jgi:hypothetical protein